jgi:hypothetical protein
MSGFYCTLTNAGDKSLSFEIPSHEDQISVILLTHQGRMSHLNDLIKRPKHSTNTPKAAQLKSGELRRFTTRFDLTKFKTEIADRPFVEFRASYIRLGASSIESNKIRVELPH